MAESFKGELAKPWKKRVLPQLCADFDARWWGVKGSAILMKRVHPQKDPRTNLARVKIRASLSSSSTMCSWWLLGNWSRDLYMQYWLGRAGSLFTCCWHGGLRVSTQDGGLIWRCSRHMQLFSGRGRVITSRDAGPDPFHVACRCPSAHRVQ